MEIQLTAKHLKITPAISDYVRHKMEKAQKYFDHIIWGQAVLFIEKRAHNAEMVIHAPGQTFRALATAADLYSAIDLASDKIDAQLKKYKERLKSRHKGRPKAAAELLPAAVFPRGSLRVAVARQGVSPTTPEEAIEEMERLGHAFRMFQDRDSHQIQVVYRSSEDSYRVLQPVKKGDR